MSTILLSIKPIYVEQIFNGTKMYEYRKKECQRKIDKIIVYSTSPIKKVVGELTIKSILVDNKRIIWDKTYKNSGISKEKFEQYFSNQEKAVAFEIESYKKYDKCKDLSDYNLKCAPQLYVYINDRSNYESINNL